MSVWKATPLIAALLASGTHAVNVFSTAETCTSPKTSCQDTATASCCFNSPGGQLLQVQFWDTDPVTGPANSWTIHGLWPDNCDGTYEEDCDSSRDYTDIGTLLDNAGYSDYVSYMNTFWVSDDESNEAFWEHEWSTHGTCINTIDPSCYTDYSTGDEAVDFFTTVVDLFQTLPTYETLSAAGIVPSNTKTYTLAALQAAIKASFGYEAVFLCDDDALYEIYYTFNVEGNLITGTFIPTTPPSGQTTCPSTGIKYPLKSGAKSVTSSVGPTGTGSATATATRKTTTSAATTTSTATTKTRTVKKSTSTATTASATATSTSTAGASGSGYLQAYTGGSNTGCLISYGTWYVGGTCATYDATTTAEGFTFTSSKGNCGVSGGALTCGSGVTLSTFTISDGLLAYEGSTEFYAAAVPSGSTQEDVYTSTKSVAVTFEWQSA